MSDTSDQEFVVIDEEIEESNSGADNTDNTDKSDKASTSREEQFVCEVSYISCSSTGTGTVLLYDNCYRTAMWR